MKTHFSIPAAFQKTVKLKSSLWLGLLFAACLAAPTASRAGLIASDNAGNYSSWGSLYNGATQGAASGTTGISGWTFDNTSTGNGSVNGSFLGGSAQVGQSHNINSSSGSSWGLYANSGNTAGATASFSSTLSGGQQLSLQMQNNFIQNNAGTVGFSLRNSSGQNVVELYFIGGGSAYDVNVWSSGSSSSQYTTSVGYTSSPLAIVLNQGSGSAWSLSINGSVVDTGSSLWSSIDQIRFFDFNSGGGSVNNVYFNNLEINAVPEPITLALPIFGGVVLTAGLARRFISRPADPVG